MTLLAAAAAAALAQPRHVILITIDGGAASHLENPNVILPNIRALAKDGVWAESSESVFPSITYPSHTTLITGVYPRKHGVLANELPQAGSDLMVNAATLPRAKAIWTKTIFDSAKAKGLSTAAFAWPETIADPNIDYNLGGRSRESSLPESTPWFAELRANGVPVDIARAIRRTGASGVTVDDAVTLAACDTIRNHKPNLLAIHLVNTDHEQHTYGPEHALAHASLTEADAMIGRIVKATKDAGIYDQTVFVVTADHGFTSVYWEINLAPFFAEADLTEKVKIYEGGWAPFLRLLPNFDKAADMPRLERVFDRLRQIPQLQRIYKSEEYPALGLPRFEDSDRVRGQYLLMLDPDTYFVEAPDNSTELRRRKRPAHGHGYLPTSPKMYPMLVLAGPGLRKGIRIGHVKSTDIAPTISNLLGLAPLDFDGRVLTESLAK